MICWAWSSLWKGIKTVFVLKRQYWRKCSTWEKWNERKDHNIKHLKNILLLKSRIGINFWYEHVDMCLQPGAHHPLLSVSSWMAFESTTVNISAFQAHLASYRTVHGSAAKMLSTRPGWLLSVSARKEGNALFFVFETETCWWVCKNARQPLFLCKNIIYVSFSSKALSLCSSDPGKEKLFHFRSQLSAHSTLHLVFKSCGHSCIHKAI